MPFNPNVYSGKKRKAQDVSQLMRDINALEGVKADETLTTTLTPQYGIIIGAGGALTAPRYCDVDSAGNIYVSDYSRAKIVKYTAAGNYVTEWGTIGTNPGEFDSAGTVGISVDPSDNVWVVNSGRGVVIKFNSSGTYQTEWAADSPIGIDTPADGYVYVSGTTYVRKYNTAGVEQAAYTGTGMVTCWDVAVGLDGMIYVANTTLFTGTPIKIDPSGPTYTNIGTVGTSAGKFQAPKGITVDASGNIYISDATRQKVIIYDSTLTYVTEFGTSGTGVGQFTEPYGLCLTKYNDLLIPDATRGKVLKLIPSYAITNTTPTYTSTPIAAAAGPTYLYILMADGKIWQYTISTMAFSRQFSSGFSSGYAAYNLAADSSDNVYIVGNATLGNSRLAKYNSSGVAQATVTLTSSAYPNVKAMAIDGSNNLLILGQASTTKVFVFNTSLSYTGTTYTITGGTGAIESRAILATSGTNYAIVPQAYRYLVNLYTGATYTGNVNGFSLGGGSLFRKFPDFGGSSNYIACATDSDFYALSSNAAVLSHFTAGTGFSFYAICANTTYAFYVARAGYSIAYSVARVTLPATTTYTFVFEIPDGVSSAISNPTDVVADATNLHITDTGNNRVIKYTQTDGQYVSAFGSAGSGNGQFSAPKGIAKDSGGNIWVVDSGNSRVQKFNSAGTYQSQFGSAGSGNGQFSSPDRIHIDASDNIYITDKSNHRIQVFNSSGSFLRKFGTTGSANGNLSSPVGVAKNPVTGHVYVANTANHRMEVFYEFDANTAKYVSRWGSSGSSTTSRQFSSPEGIDVDDSGHMWIADTGNNRIARIAAHGKLSTFYGTVGSGDGNFSSPSGLSVYQNELYVVDRGNARIRKFLIGESALVDSDVQTAFRYYITPSGERSMGTPDRGVHVPDLGALAFPPSADELGDNVGVNLSATKYMTDMRTAVERLAASGVFTDGADGVAVDWSAGTSSLYKRALSGRHDLYGVPEADGTAKRTWTQGALRKKPLADLDIGEIYETVRKLKETTWGVVP